VTAPGANGRQNSNVFGSAGMMYLYVIAFVVVVWIAVAATGLIKPFLLPQAADAFDKLLGLFGEPGTLLVAVATTGWTVLVAFLAASVVGITIGVVIGSRTDFSSAYEPLLANLTAIPLVLLYPLLLGALGSGPPAKMIVGGIAAGLPIAIASHWAMREITPELLDAARSMGASRFARMRSVVLPETMPGIFGGLRTAIGLAVVTVVAGEFLSSPNGLGHELAQASESFQTPALFAWLIVTVAFTAAAVGILNVIQALIYRKVHR
jgi:NitT/TauT family transport system permease protein